MKNILFLSNTRLDNPIRGTPLRICSILRQIAKKHTLWVCVATISEEFKPLFVPYPAGGVIARVCRLRQLIREHRIEWVMTSTEIGITVPVILKILCGVRIAMDLHGLMHEERYAVGKISRAQYWYTYLKTYALLSFYDEVFPVTESLSQYYAWASRGKWRTIYGGVVPTHSDMPMEPVGNVFVIGYMGNARTYQGLQYILDATVVLRHRNIPVHLNLIISDITTEVTSLLEKRGLLYISAVHSNVSHDEARSLILKSNVLAITRPAIPVTQYAFPSKLPEYLETGIPLIVTEVGPITELRPEIAEHCIIIGHENITSDLTAALIRIHSMSPETRKDFGKKAREYAIRTFNWDLFGGVLNDALDH